jgi:hypothetical protein
MINCRARLTRYARRIRGRVYPGVKFDASGLSSGVYLARLTVTDEMGQVKFSRINKLILAK